MRIAIVGVGAVGGVFGALLARAGHTVSFVAQGETLATLRSSGLVATTPDGVIETGPMSASNDPAELGVADVVFVAVKSWQVAALAPSLAPLIGPNTLVLSMQNGVEAATQLAAALGATSVVGSLCHVLATREGPGRMGYVGAAPTITFGERGGGISARLSDLATTLRAAGFSVNLSNDIEADLWKKLLFVEPFGSVGAVTSASVDVVRAIPETRAMLERAMREVRAVAAGHGVAIPEESVLQSLARIDGMPIGATASMHRDLFEGRPSELHEQTGAVVRLGAAVAVPCPVHELLFASLLPRELRARAASSATH